MKRFVIKKDSDDLQIDLTPMLDVIFIMLIFFLVTASFIRESGINISKPIAKNYEFKNPNIIVALSKNHEIWIDKKKIDIYFLSQILKDLRLNNAKNSIIIQADKDVSTGFLVQVMDEIKLANIKDIFIATKKE